MAETKQRARPARGGRTKRPPTWFWIVVPVLALASVVAVVALTQRDSARGPLEALPNDPGVVHIHGLGINPRNGDVYAATHMGVFHIADGEATRIANRYQDTMGFTVVGPDHFIASGHPDLREELPPLLGLLESRNAGRTWTKKSLLGKSDFHVLRYAHQSIWGYDSTSGALMVSEDGTEWDERSTLVLRDFAVSPDSPDVVLATNGEGLRRSEDGGRTWKDSEAPAAPLLLDWQQEGDLWLVDTKGLVYRSADSMPRRTTRSLCRRTAGSRGASFTKARKARGSDVGDLEPRSEARGTGT
jgi:hypothetical protein